MGSRLYTFFLYSSSLNQKAMKKEKSYPVTIRLRPSEIARLEAVLIQRGQDPKIIYSFHDTLRKTINNVLGEGSGHG